ncbi:hypothetical protein [Planobispora rosea]|uniref:hypothetical protein n=1 Tax=Planobispora rosea TaxID=35762 RepID=UPI00083A48AC|nr:hypothetical protein [Planobispora rosea]
MPTPRQLLILAAAAGSVILIALVTLASAGAVSPAVAALLGMAAVLLGVQLLIVTEIRRVDGKALRADARTKRCETGIAQVAAAVERLDSRIGEIAESLGRERHRHDEDLRAILASLGEERLHAMSLRQEMKELVDDLLPRIASGTAGTPGTAGTDVRAGRRDGA